MRTRLHITILLLMAASCGMAQRLVSIRNTQAFTVYRYESRPGFVILSNNRRMPRILGQSDTQNFDSLMAQNTGLQDLLASYSLASEQINAGKVTAAEIFGSTTNILTKTKTKTKTLEPLLGDINYDQSSPYNEKCPLSHGVSTITGCTATAMAQLMKYYEYPQKGKGTVTYKSIAYGDTIPISDTLSRVSLDWPNILSTYAGPAHATTENVQYDTAFTMQFYDRRKPDDTIISCIRVDSLNAYCLTVQRIFNMTQDTIQGYMQMIVEDSAGTLRRRASSANYINLRPRYGWNYYHWKPDLPQDLPDGVYRIYIGYTTDSIHYRYAKTYADSTVNYYVLIEKRGDKTQFQGYEFACAPTQTQVDAVATLMRACGVACKSNYGTSAQGGTSSTVYRQCAGLYTNFGYDQDMYKVSKASASTDQIYAEAVAMLRARHPISVGGYTDESGHAFLIDGYDLTDSLPYFHINWGWSGSSNGYFLLTQMKPSEAGAGGSATNYSQDFDLLMNAFPNDTIAASPILSCTELRAYKDSAYNHNSLVGADTLQQGDTLTIRARRVSNAFQLRKIKGDIDCYLVDSIGTAHDLGLFKNITLSATGHFDTCQVNLQIPDTLPAGNYHVELRMGAAGKFFCLQYPTITISAKPESTPAPDETPTGVTAPAGTTDANTLKLIHNGHLYLLRNGRKYDASGQQLK